MKPILNIDEAQGFTFAHGEAFEAHHTQLSRPLGGKRIGASLTTVKPGKAAFPFHHHYGNEEHFLILRGMGTLRVGDATYPVRPGDYMVHPPGRAETAHQLVNTGSEDLVYLAISTSDTPEVVGYPDSNKTAVAAEPWGEGSLRFVVHDATRDAVDYWDGEDGAKVKALLSATKGG